MLSYFKVENVFLHISEKLDGIGEDAIVVSVQQRNKVSDVLFDTVESLKEQGIFKIIESEGSYTCIDLCDVFARQNHICLLFLCFPYKAMVNSDAVDYVTKALGFSSLLHVEGDSVPTSSIY